MNKPYVLYHEGKAVELFETFDEAVEYAQETMKYPPDADWDIRVDGVTVTK